jgi:phosphate/sulfate permease
MADETLRPDTRSDVEPESRLGRKLLTVGLVAVLLVAAYVFAVSVLPRWWAQQVGDQVDGDLTTGGLLGFMYGFLATFLPLLVLGVVWRFRRDSVLAWVIGVSIALILAAPNLVTLGISIGNGSAAHAADRTLDVEAPWFRGGMVVGVVVAALLAFYVAYVLASRSRARSGERAARERLEAGQRERETPSTDDPRPGPDETG